MKWILVAWLFLFNNSNLQQPEFIATKQVGKVVKIIDGDTFDMLTKEKITLRILMNGIDCPERKQPFYQAAKNALSGYIFSKEVKLFVSSRDRNKRLIATVYCNGRNINLAMVNDGYAWHYKKYSTDTMFAKAEQQARKAKKGLWSMNNPVPPWEFRKK